MSRKRSQEIRNLKKLRKGDLETRLYNLKSMKDISFQHRKYDCCKPKNIKEKVPISLSDHSTWNKKRVNWTKITANIVFFFMLHAFNLHRAFGAFLQLLLTRRLLFIGYIRVSERMSCKHYQIFVYICRYFPLGLMRDVYHTPAIITHCW